jgi:uncharacterized C2H2 Zn-finger protein
MKNKFLSIIAAGLMLGGVSQVKAMDLPPLFHTQQEQELLEVHDMQMLLSGNKRSIDQVYQNADDALNNNALSAQKPFKCPYPGCNVTFTNKKAISPHINSVHTHEASFTCHFCALNPNTDQEYLNKKFYAHSTFLSHLRSHTQPHQCDQCHKRFISKLLLSNHREHKHGTVNNAAPANPQASPCFLCGLQGITDLPNHKSQCKELLTYALRQMSVEPTDENIANVGFNEQAYAAPSPATMYEEIEQKEGDTILHKYRCLYPIGRGVCGALTNPHQSSIKAHQVIHRDEKQFKCSLCPSTFKRKDGLAVHYKKIHLSPNTLNQKHNDL